MRKILLLVAMGFFYTNIYAQTETFDIATYSPPKGWERVVSNGVLLFQDMKTNNGETMFCHIFLYPSRVKRANPTKNFESEWIDKVVKPTGSKERPKIATGKTPDGWTVVTGLANITHEGVTFTCILVSASGFGKQMSVLVKVAGQEYLTEVQSFLNTLELSVNSADDQRSVKGQIAAAADKSNAWDQYIYTAPEGLLYKKKNSL